jgi:uncharacterized repeat protein (TIGR01451 family)
MRNTSAIARRAAVRARGVSRQLLVPEDHTVMHPMKLITRVMALVGLTMMVLMLESVPWVITPARAQSVIKTIPVGGGPVGVGVNPTTNLIYVVNSLSKTASVIDGAANSVKGTPIPVGGLPEKVGVNPTTNRIYVTNGTDATVSVIDDSPTPPDLAVSKTGPSTVTLGNTIAYTLTVTNSGPGAAQNVTLSDPLPANTSFVSLTQTAGPAFACTTPALGGTGTVSCTTTSLAAGVAPPPTLSLVVRNNPATPIGSTLTNTATVSSASPDSATANNTATVTTTVLAPPSIRMDGGAQLVATGGGQASVGFAVQTANGVSSGKLDYKNDTTGLRIRGPVSLVFAEDPTARQLSFSGTTEDGACTFTVTAQDVADPGDGQDTFRLDVACPVGSALRTEAQTPITQGDIRFRP